MKRNQSHLIKALQDRELVFFCIVTRPDPFNRVIGFYIFRTFSVELLLDQNLKHHGVNAIVDKWLLVTCTRFVAEKVRIQAQKSDPECVALWRCSSYVKIFRWNISINAAQSSQEKSVLRPLMELNCGTYVNFDVLH
jgi:hypothetical protein